uniref:Uncharacterized protein n=1 Tax=Nelumbo nucifera TaxID=4432 RepID=A0A822Z2E5_NELNU|nr:TPA_asm: hypothetical protein HUJ06_008246 [Nelumbo nucifera]
MENRKYIFQGRGKHDRSEALDVRSIAHSSYDIRGISDIFIYGCFEISIVLMNCHIFFMSLGI